MGKLFKQRWGVLGLLTVLGVLCIFITVNSVTLQSLEETILDIKFRNFQREVSTPDVALVMIDQQSLDQLGKNLQVYWPWPREFYGILHDYLSAKGAKKVVYDILFDQPDFDRYGFTGNESDRKFEGSIGIRQNSILAAYTISDSQSENDIPYTYKVNNWPNQTYYSVQNLPIQNLLNATSGIGSVNILNQDESLIRSLPLFYKVSEGEFIPSLAMAVFLSNFKDASLKYEDNTLLINNKSIPVNEDGDFLINWYSSGGGGNIKGSFDNYSFIAVLLEAIQFSQTRELTDSEVDVNGKVVFIGASAAGLGDIKSTPMSILEPFPGAEIHATAYQNFSSNDFLKVISPQNIFFQVGIFLILTVLIFGLFLTPYQLNIPISFTILVGSVLIGLYLFAEHRIWFPTGQTSFIFGITLGVSYVTKYITEDWQKVKLKNAFSRYVQKELVSEIIESSEDISLGGVKRELTIMFTDLAGFTSLSEDTEPEELILYLNEYLECMSQIVFKNGGTLDKYIGDAIMAFWGAPLRNENHAEYACRCALQMQDKLIKLQEDWEKKGRPIPIVRYGINTGEVVVGNIGSENRFDYTVLGDHVNLAARLEPANKDFGTYLLISEYTYTHIKETFICREVAKIKVKGRQESIRIYELLAEKSLDSNKRFDRFVNDFEIALNEFYKGNFDNAASLFLDFKKVYGEDPLTESYLEKISHYQAFPVSEFWEGIHEQLTK